MKYIKNELIYKIIDTSLRCIFYVTVNAKPLAIYSYKFPIKLYILK